MGLWSAVRRVIGRSCVLCCLRGLFHGWQGCCVDDIWCWAELKLRLCAVQRWDGSCGVFKSHVYIYTLYPGQRFSAPTILIPPALYLSHRLAILVKGFIVRNTCAVCYLTTSSIRSKYTLSPGLLLRIVATSAGDRVRCCMLEPATPRNGRPAFLSARLQPPHLVGHHATPFVRQYCTVCAGNTNSADALSAKLTVSR